MPFILSKERRWSATDSDTNARMEIDSFPDSERLVRFSKPEMKIELWLSGRAQFPHRARLNAGSNNPGIMIEAGSFNRMFLLEPQFADYDFERKTQFAEYFIRMMAFINKHHPLGYPPFFWSNYEDYVSDRSGHGRPLLFRMPSNEELIRFSMEA